MKAELVESLARTRAAVRRERDALNQVDASITALLGLADDVDGRRAAQPGVGGAAKAVKSSRAVKGTAKLVLGVIGFGADTVAKIAKAAQVKEATARAAVLDLEAAGKVKRVGKSRATRYVPK